MKRRKILVPSRERNYHLYICVNTHCFYYGTILRYDELIHDKPLARCPACEYPAEVFDA